MTKLWSCHFWGAEVNAGKSLFSGTLNTFRTGPSNLHTRKWPSILSMSVWNVVHSWRLNARRATAIVHYSPANKPSEPPKAQQSGASPEASFFAFEPPREVSCARRRNLLGLPKPAAFLLASDETHRGKGIQASTKAQAQREVNSGPGPQCYRQAAEDEETNFSKQDWALEANSGSGLRLGILLAVVLGLGRFGKARLASLSTWGPKLVGGNILGV